MFPFKSTSVQDLVEYYGIYNCLKFAHGHTVSNKYTHLADFETCVFRVYPRNHLSYKKVIYIYLNPCQLSDEEMIFEIRSQNQLVFSKTLFCQEKS